MSGMDDEWDGRRVAWTTNGMVDDEYDELRV